MVDKYPRNWAICTIHDLIGKDGIFSDGDWIESKDQDPSGSVRLIQLADVGVGEFKDKSSRFLTQQKATELNCTFLEDGDVLISRLPDPLGKCCLFPLSGDQAFVTAVDVSIVRLHREVDPTWFVYFFNAPPIKHQIYQHQTGTTRKRISRKNLGKINLALPPKDEQRRIFAKIEELFSELDKGVQSLETARAQLQTYRQSLLKAAFEGRLTEQWRRDNADKLETTDQLLEHVREEREARYQQKLEEWKAAIAKWEENGKIGKKPTKPTIDKPLPEISDDELEILPRIPRQWKYVRLYDVATVGSGVSLSKDREIYNPIEVPYLRVANVQRGKLVLDEVKTMAVERTALRSLLLRKWDILFNEGGDRDKLGRGWVWENQIDTCITQNHVFRATTYLGDEFQSKFISYWGNVFGRDYFEKFGKQTTNLASINKTVLKMFPVPLPPLYEQREIVQRIEAIDTEVALLENQIKNELSRSEALRQSILKRAFEGKLVSQDPNDEPASVLLERIRQGQADQPKTKRRQQKSEASA